MCRVNVNAKLCTALATPYVRLSRSDPPIGAAARAPVPPIRTCEYPFIARNIATVSHMPASIAPMASPMSASVLEPPPEQSI